MKFFILSFALFSHTLYAQENLVKEIKLSRADLILAEKITALLKMGDEGNYNPTLTKQVKTEITKSKNYTPFIKWVNGLETVSLKKNPAELAQHCTDLSLSISEIPLEKLLDQKLSFFCREKAIDLIGREIDKTNKLAEYADTFIKNNLKFYLQKPHQKSFSYFLQSQNQRPDILQKLSAEITEHSLKNQVTPSHEILQDILIDDKITSLVQNNGLKPLEFKNVFYSEYGRLIEEGYKVLNADKPDESKLKKHVEFLKNYLELNYSYLPTNLCLTRLNDFAKAVYRLGHADLSRKILTYVISKKDSEVEYDARFFYLWTYIQSSDLKNAVKYIKRDDLITKIEKNKDAQLRYWVAYVFEKDDKKDDAAKIYEKIVADTPLSYYAIMASKRLHSIKPDSTVASFYHIEARRGVNQIATMNDFDQDHQASFVRLLAWSKIDNASMIDLELRRLNQYSLPLLLGKKPIESHTDYKEIVHLIQANIIQTSQNYLMTFRYIYNLLDNQEIRFSRNVLELLYPRLYLDILKKNLKNHDSLLVLSLIRQESVFNPEARSPVGARGLMQLMPTTAKRMRKSVSVAQLSNPKVNIELGTKYFEGLMKRYDNNLVHVLSAYNAGETRVERWKKQYFDEDETIVRNIETIPFKETRTYVKLIFRNLFFYKLLASEELVDNPENNKIFNVTLGYKH